jgi:hypothetical protein
MAFAINIITESTDHYLIVLDGKPTIEDIINEVEKELGEEIYYISSFNTKATYKCSEDFVKSIRDKLFSFETD